MLIEHAKSRNQSKGVEPGEVEDSYVHHGGVSSCASMHRYIDNLFFDRRQWESTPHDAQRLRIGGEWSLLRNI
jgi:hypothetical protein